MKISKKVIIISLTLIIISIAIGIYFLLKNNKSSSNQTVIPTITNGPNTVGFCHSTTFNGVDQPQTFRSVDEMENTTSVLQLADVGGFANGIQYKWSHDPANVVNITRNITNSSNAYSAEELSALGQLKISNGNYLVNKIITIYDKNDPKYKIGQLELNPYIITTMSNCK